MSAVHRLKVPAAFVVAGAVLLLVMPALLSDYRLNLFGRYLCLGIVGVGIGLAWGRGGMLTLGQGVFFGLGGYAMAMHMKLDDAGPGQAPDFMLLYGDGTVPWWWEPFRSPVVTLLAVVLLPMAAAALLGALVFWRKVRGAYFAILSQALAGAFALWIVGQQATTAGMNGLTDMKNFFGYDRNDPVNQQMIYSLVVLVLLGLLWLTRQLMLSRYGELLVAVRDAEERVRFLGYEPAAVKLTAFVLAAGMAGLGGALFVPLAGLIAPALIGIVPSIEFVIGVAVGGRATWLGPAIGAVAVAWAKTSLSEKYPGQWTYFEGALFILVIAFLPKGLASLPDLVRARRRGAPVAAAATAPDGASSDAASAQPLAVPRAVDDSGTEVPA